MCITYPKLENVTNGWSNFCPPPNNAFSGSSHAIEHSRFEEKPKHEELQWLKP